MKPVALTIRRRALRLWNKGAPRKMIAELCEVCEATVKDWRYRYQWPSRKAYRDRPVVNKPLQAGRPVKGRLPGRCRFGCPRCGYRASDPKGHPACVEVA